MSEPTERTPKRRLPRWAYLAASAGGGAAMIFVARLIVGPTLPGQPMTGAQILTFTGLTLLAVVWVLSVGIASFRRLDEFQQTGDKFAWYWGGTFGCAVSAVVYAFVALNGPHWAGLASQRLDRNVYDAFQLGYFTAIGPIVIGFLAVRLWWRVTRR